MRITNAVEANAILVAEYSISQILFCLKSGRQLIEQTRRNSAFPAKPLHVRGIFRSTLGLISLSTVGRKTAELVKNFDLDGIAYDSFIEAETAQELGGELVSLEDVFKESDVVSLHTPLLKETIGLIEGNILKQ